MRTDQEVQHDLSIIMYEIMGEGSFPVVDVESLQCSLQDALEDMDEGDRFRVEIVNGDDPGELVLKVLERSAVDRLAELTGD